MRITSFIIIGVVTATLVFAKEIPDASSEEDLLRLVKPDERKGGVKPDEQTCKCSCGESQTGKGRESEQDGTRAFQLATSTCNCACVVCTFTVDNKVEWAKYNGLPLQISGGNVNDWRQEKVISFQSCCDNCPGVLEIKGSNWENSNHCYWAGLLLRCTASRASSPWHNFISDKSHWKNELGGTPCQNDLLFPQSGSWINFIASLNAYGAKKIWGKKKVETLWGSPAF